MVLSSDTPSSFDNNGTQLCGVSYPSAKPLSSLQNCCDGPVQMYNGCLQYCFVQGDPLDFRDCAAGKVEHDGPLASKCNFAGTSAGVKQEIGRTKENAGSAGRGGRVKWQALLVMVGSIGAARMVV